MTTLPHPPLASTVVDRLAALADEAGDRPAIEAPGAVVTYAGLHRAIGRVAATLTGQSSLEAHPPVAVYGPAGSPTVAEVTLGALAAGHPALVLEPRAPNTLLRRWLAAAGIDAVLTCGGDDAADAASRTGRRTLDAAPPPAGPPPMGPPPAGPPVDSDGPRPEDAALVLATGTDDGLPLRWLSHAALAHRAATDAHAAGLRPPDRVAVVAPLSSGPGGRALLATLWAGATAVLPGPDPAAGHLAGWLGDASVTVALLTPTLVRLADAGAGECPGLRTLAVLVSRAGNGVIDAGGAPSTGRGAGDRSTPVPTLAAAPGARVVALPEPPDPPDPPTPRDPTSGGTTPDPTHAGPEVEAAPGDRAGPPVDAPPDDASPDDASPDDTPPDDEVAATLAAIWEELLDQRPVPRDRDFFELGGYSLLAARMLVLFEQRTGRRLPMAVFLEATTIEELADAAHETAGAPHPDPVLVRLQPGEPGRAPLFVTHDLQGSAYRLRPLAEAVGVDVPVYGFESPFLEGRHQFATIEALAAHYVDALRAVQPEGPYHLCGYSFGGILAFEMARRLRDAGDEVALLGVIDVGPGYRGLDYSRTALPPLPYLRDAIEGPDGRLPGWATPVRRLWLNRPVLAARWRRRLGRGHAVAPEERLWFAWWAHWHLVGPSWTASPYDGRIDLFWADTTVGTDATMGWGEHAAEVVVHHIDGRHESLMAAPAVDAIGAGLRTRLVAGRSSR